MYVYIGRLYVATRLGHFLQYFLFKKGKKKTTIACIENAYFELGCTAAFHCVSIIFQYSAYVDKIETLSSIKLGYKYRGKEANSLGDVDRQILKVQSRRVSTIIFAFKPPRSTKGSEASTTVTSK